MLFHKDRLSEKRSGVSCRHSRSVWTCRKPRKPHAGNIKQFGRSVDQYDDDLKTARAGIQRFRPILLTTVTTFGGLMPMILEKSFQARMMIPVAISPGFGVHFATVIILVLVPSFYLIIDDFSRLVKRRKKAHKRSGQPASIRT